MLHRIALFMAILIACIIIWGNPAAAEVSSPLGVVLSPVKDVLYDLTYTAGPGGHIEGEASQSVPRGIDGTPVTAVPDTGHHFVQWSDGSTANPRQDLAVMDNITVEASFAPGDYTLTYSAGLNGYIEGETTQSVPHAQDGTPVTAVPNDGAFFVKWSDGNLLPSRQDISILRDLTVEAIFGVIIDSIEELQLIGVDSLYPLDGYYRMDADIDASGAKGYTPIGSIDTPFTGHFDGNGFAITGFYYHSWDTSYNGVLRVIGAGGSVSNLTLTNVNVPSYGANTGALCGENSGLIKNCHAAGSVYNSDYAPYRGGLVGTNTETGIIEDSSSAAEVCGRGGSVGGLAGINYGTLTRCHATGNVHGRECVGGLIGYCLFGTLTQCYATGNVDNVQEYGPLGGLCGVLGASTVRECFATGNVTSPEGFDVGAFSGDGWGVDFKYCFATGKVTAPMARCSALIGGQTDGPVDSCYGVGPVSGGVTAGLLGYDGGPLPSFTKCYWDLDTTGQTESVTGQPEASFGKTTAEMLQAATFVDWNVGSATPFVNIEDKTYPFFQWKAPEVLSLVPVGFPAADTVQFLVTFSMPIPGLTTSDLIVTADGATFDSADITPVEANHPTQWLLNIHFTGNNGEITVEIDVEGVIVSGAVTVLTALPPSDVAATDIGQDTITWTWADNSSSETGFDLFAGPGATPPQAAAFTAPAESTSWTQTPLSANAQYAFQAAAVFPGGNTLKSESISAWTLAYTPFAPYTYTPDDTTVYVSGNSGEGNPDYTGYAIHIVPGIDGNEWVQPDGSLGSTPSWQTLGSWGGVYVYNLDSQTTYMVTMVAINGAGVQTPESLGALVHPWWTVNYTADANGYIEGEATQSVLNGQSTSPVTAVANEGYHFTQWDDGWTDNPRQDEVYSDFTVQAWFAPNEYTLTYEAGPGGYLEGETVQTVTYGSDGSPVTAVPETNYRFVQWSDGSTGNPRTDTNVTANINVTAEFTLSSEGEGGIEGEGEGGIEGEGEGGIEGEGEGGIEGEGVTEGDVEGTVEGAVEGSEEGQADPWHTSDQNQDNLISLSELLRVIQFFNSGGYHACPEQGTEDGFCPGV